MSLFWSQVSALLWKNWILTKRSMVVAVLKTLVSFGLIFYTLEVCYLFTIAKFEEKSLPLDNRQMLYMGLMIVFAVFSMPFVFLMHEVVHRVMLEKTTKIREHLRIQGVGEAPYAVSYVLHYFRIAAVWMSLPVIIVLLSSSYSLGGDNLMLLPLLYFLCLMSGSAVAYAQCALFDNVKFARFFAFAGWFIPALPVQLELFMKFNRMRSAYAILPTLHKIACVLKYLHPAGLLACILNPMYTEDPGHIPLKLFLIPLFQTVIYTALGIYLHQVIKSQHGSSRPWNFFLKSKVKATSSHVTATPANPSRFEPVDSARPAGVVFDSVVKEFDNGSVVAVADLSLRILQNEIFALLGHNGAGKTTLLECLVGMKSITRGRIILNGVDVSNGLSDAAGTVGICPQFDAFYPNFKPLEILELYGRIRGQHSVRAHSNAEMMLERLGLLRKMHSKAKDLSGGQKRKLSVGMAFSGDSKTIVLDEPSSGLDIESSLELWTVIRILREGRTIIMTTHNMNEAESLGDRIGIMSAGSMQCLGSPLFLKSRLGSGYMISFKFQEQSDADPIHVKNFVNGIIPNAELLPLQSGYDLSFQISNESVHLMSSLLHEIELQKANFQLQDFVLVPSRLDDVFLKITKEHEEQLCENLEKQKTLPSYTPVPVSIGTDIVSILILLWHYFRTDFGFLLSLSLPILLSAMSCAEETNLLQTAIVMSVYICAPHACSNVSYFNNSDIRLLLDIFGVNPFVYWLAMVVSNLIQAAVPFAIIFATSALADVSLSDSEYYTAGVISALVFAMVGFMACIRSVAKSYSPFMVTFFPAIVLVFLSANFSAKVPFLEYVLQACQIHPPFLFLHHQFGMNSIAPSMLTIVLIVLGITYFATAIAVDYHRLHPNCFSAFKSEITGLETGRVSDEDIQMETERIKSGANDILQVVDLAKAYDKTVAVRGINVGVPGGQSLAFLGVNGSGKTSSIQCMLGISAPSRGYVKVAGVNVNEDESGARHHIGYVPQHDNILVGKMTGRQQLMFIARLAGVPENVQPELVSNMLFNVGLDKAADRRSETYSGGMKRKLCVAIALMIKRSVVLLDEPSTGVDPASRRRFWSMFAQVQSDPSRCLLLTTHQLDEAEAVCDRISIMVNGEIMCLGSAGHLKRKFGNHYQVDLNATAVANCGIVRNWFTNKYPRAVLVEADGAHLRFWLAKSQVASLSDLFSFVHNHQGIPIQDAVVGEATMEQIFLSIAYKSKRDPNAHQIQVYNQF